MESGWRWSEIVERHEVLRSGIVEEGGEARARVGVGGGLELAVIDLEEVKEEEREEKSAKSWGGSRRRGRLIVKQGAAGEGGADAAGRGRASAGSW